MPAFAGHTTVRDTLASYGSHCSAAYGFARSTGFLPSLVDPGFGLNNAVPSVQLHYRAFIPTTLLRTAPPLCPASVLSSSQGPPAWISPLTSGRQVPAFHIEAWIRVTPPSCRMPPGQKSGHPPDSSQVNEFPLVSTSSCTFRHFISGSLALVSLNLTRRGQAPPFPQRSPPRLFSVAACGGL